MNIIVCIKQIPSETSVPFSPEGRMLRETVDWNMGKEDGVALEAALQIKDKDPNCNVYVLTMGTPKAKSMLFEALGKGADHGYLISDPAYAGSDSLGTSIVLSKAISYLPPYDLIFFGYRSQDAGTANLSGQVAGKLDLPEIRNVLNFALEKKDVLTLSESDHDHVKSRCPMPAVLSFHRDANHPRLPNFRLLSLAYASDKIDFLSQADLNLPLDKIGLKGASARILDSFTPVEEKVGLQFSGPPEETTTELFKKLLEDPIFLKEVGI